MVDGQRLLFDVRGRLCERNPDPGSTSTVLECGHAGLVVNQLCLLEQVAEYHLLLSLAPGDVIEVQEEVLEEGGAEGAESESEGEEEEEEWGEDGEADAEQRDHVDRVTS